MGGGTSYDSGNGIASDAAGNTYVAGYFSETATFGDSTWTTPSSMDYDIVVGKIDPGGNWLWAKRAGGTDYDKANAISLGSDGSIYICGIFSGTASFGSHTVVSAGTAVRSDVFVAKLSVAGDWEWVSRAGGSEHDYAYGICMAGTTGLRVCGEYKGTSDFGSTNLTGSSTNVFIAALDTSGNWLWARSAGGSNSDYSYSVCADATGNCVFTGRFSGFAWFGSTNLTASGTYDIFAAKLDPDGNWLWATKAGGSSQYDNANGVACDATGDYYLTGCFGGTASFGTEISLTAGSGRDIFIGKLSASGTWLWARGSGASIYDVGFGVTVYNSGNCVATGCFGGTASFGSTSLVAGASTDVFVCALNSSGDWLWAVNSASAAVMEGYGIASAPSGYVIAGMYQNAAAQFGATILPQLGEADMFIACLAFNTGPPIPLPPQNLVISIEDGTVYLSWDSVTHDTSGQPITIHHYNVYRTSDLAAGFGSVGSTFTPSWTGSAIAYERRFYRVTAATE